MATKSHWPAPMAVSATSGSRRPTAITGICSAALISAVQGRKPAFCCTRGASVKATPVLVLA
jgi:hypothetical protein